MSEKELIELLNQQQKIKAPKALKKEILNRLEILQQAKTKKRVNTIIDFKDGGVLLFLIVLSSTLLLLKSIPFEDASFHLLDRVNISSIERILYVFSTLFFVCVVEKFLSVKQSLKKLRS